MVFPVIPLFHWRTKTVGVGFSLDNHEVEQYEYPHNRHESDESPSASLAHVVESTNTNCNSRQQDGKTEQRINHRDNQSQHSISENASENDKKKIEGEVDKIKQPILLATGTTFKENILVFHHIQKVRNNLVKIHGTNF